MGIVERKEREKEERRNSIIDASEKVFFSKGFESATMDDIAEEAELSKGTLYLYFKSKESLYTAVNHRGLTILGEMFRNAVDVTCSGIENLNKIGDAYFRFANEYRDYFWALVFYEARRSENAPEDETVEACQLQGKETLSHLINVVKMGIDDGTVNPKYKPEVLAVLLWGTSMGLIQMHLVRRDSIEKMFNLDMEEILGQYFSLIRDAIRTR